MRSNSPTSICRRLLFYMKKSFILYNDSLKVLDDLDDYQTAELFRAIRAYNIGKETNLKGLMNAVFTPFKNQFDRDLEAYEKQSERNRLNGKNGGRPPKPTESDNNPKNPLGFSITEQNPKNHDKENDTDNVNETDNDNDNETFELSVFSQKPTKIKKTIEERETEFYNIVAKYANQYDKSVLREFFDYWTEKNTNGKKMRYEMQKTFEISKRLATWSKNQKQFNNGKSTNQPEWQRRQNEVADLATEARRLLEGGTLQNNSASHTIDITDYSSVNK